MVDKIDIVELSSNDSFCVYPWIHQMVNQQGECHLCCTSNLSPVPADDGTPALAYRDGLRNIWNNKNMQEVRAKMLTGEKIKTCEHCYYMESLGSTSWRQQANSGYTDYMDSPLTKDLHVRIEQTIENDMSLDLGPHYLDLRFGNTCNLACRMCHPFSTNMLYDEWATIADELANKGIPEESVIFSMRDNIQRKETWPSQDIIWADLVEYAPHINTLWITGGETVIIKRNFELLQYLVDAGHNKNITLLFNTNLVTVNEKFIDLVKQFKGVLIFLSVDGTEKTQEYIRYPSNWSRDISPNLDYYLQFANNNEHVSINFSPVWQMLNMLNMRDMLIDIETRLAKIPSLIDSGRIDCNPIILYKEDYYKVEIAPVALKQECAAMLEQFKSESMYLDKWPMLLDRINSIIALCKCPTNEDELVRYHLYNDNLDAHRNINIDEYIPELNRYLK